MHMNWRAMSLAGIFVVSAAALLPASARAQAAAAPAQSGAKKELTLERIYSAPPLNWRLMQGIQWAPDGKRFSYLERKGQGANATLELWTMDAATGEKKVLIPADALKAATQPEKAKVTQATGLGRVRPDNYRWSPDSQSMLFIGTNSLVLLDLKTMATKPIVTSDHEIEDPEILPRREMDQLFTRRKSFRGERRESRRADRADHWRHRRSVEGKTRLGVPGRTRLPHRLLVVAGFHENRLLRNGRTPSNALSDHGYERAHGRHRIHALPASGRAESDRSRRRRRGHRRRNALDGCRLQHRRLSRACELAAGQPVRRDPAPQPRAKPTRSAFRECREWRVESRPHRERQILDQHQRRFVFLLRQPKNSCGPASAPASATSISTKIPASRSRSSPAAIGRSRTSAALARAPRTHPAVDEKNGYIYFLANKEDPRDTGFYRVSIADKSLTQITKEAGNHGASVSPDTSAFIDTYSNTSTPTRQDLRKIDGTSVASMADGKIPALAEYSLTAD